MKVKPAREMTDGEIQDVYEFVVAYAPVLSGTFPEERAAEIALELGRRAGVSSVRLFATMKQAWERNRQR